MTRDLYPERPILLVDDETDVLQSFEGILRNEGINHLLLCSDSRQVPGILSSNSIALVMLDLLMPHRSGEAVLEDVVTGHPDLPVVIVTAADEVDTAVRCIRRGAFDYMVKPVDPDRLVTAVRKAIEYHTLRDENRRLNAHFTRTTLEHPELFAAIVTNNSRMLDLFRYIEAVATSTQPVFITGEAGTGKELLARALHRLSGREGPFVSVNVADLDETTFAAALFGRARRAAASQPGEPPALVEQAGNGTLFLREIGRLSATAQQSLLRLLQEDEYTPVGTDFPRRATARTVLTTTRDIAGLMQAGKFRTDLYYRLLSHHIHVPPLRERHDDLPLLVDHLLEAAARELGKKAPTPPRELMTYLHNYDFPGNVQELKAMLHDAVRHHDSGILSLSTILERINGRQELERSTGNDAPHAPLQFGGRLPSLEEATHLLIREALQRTDNNQSAAARLLGISRQTLIKYCKELP